MSVIVLDMCAKEISKFPVEIKKDLLMIIEELNQGYMLSMPLSRPMQSISKGVHELRIKDRSGNYRVIYYIRTGSGEIYFLHAFKKTTKETPNKNKKLARNRLRSVK